MIKNLGEKKKKESRESCMHLYDYELSSSMIQWFLTSDLLIFDEGDLPAVCCVCRISAHFITMNGDTFFSLLGFESSGLKNQLF